ncbi:Protein CBG23648 [Caenorhabditis briggsae]|uniref:Protein CBG23648 n=1 Tax=Caenorhabditis briggsae TaxID=6238 RepID=A8WJ05_CAEBR|nr:Protein CBG23648 [Caenorhabditis briggsae]CAP20449.1 Protein CBG23648 [Caenorhabditis briggsae]
MSYNRGISKETILKREDVAQRQLWTRSVRAQLTPISHDKKVQALPTTRDISLQAKPSDIPGFCHLKNTATDPTSTSNASTQSSTIIRNKTTSSQEEDQKQDYHADMDGNHFEIYYRKMIPLFAAEAAKLGRPAVLLCDNALYHNAPLRKPPTSTSSRADITSFLTEHGVKFFPKQTKEILYDLARIFIESNGGREAFTVYKFDEYAKSHGVTVLRLPQYHLRSRAKAFLESFPATSADKLFLHTQKLETDLREMMEEKDMTDYDEVFDLNYDVDEAGNLYNIRIDSDDEDAMVDEEIETICPTDCSVSSDDDFNVFSDTEDYDFLE